MKTEDRKQWEDGISRRPVTVVLGFTLIEILVVIAIIMILAGLVLGGGRAAYLSAKRSRARAELAALEMALENFKSDRGAYPLSTLNLNDNTNNSSALYTALTGGSKRYLSFSKSQTQSLAGVTWIIDPFGQPYNYFYPHPPTNRIFLLWSHGPNEQDDNRTGDDITASRN